MKGLLIFDGNRSRGSWAMGAGVGIVFGLSIIGCGISTMSAEEGSKKGTDSERLERATVGGGCFWCIEAVYERFKGIRSVISGYAGGNTADPTYEQVCTGTTGHAEVVQVEFDPSVISYEQVLEIFWHAHDPTTLNRQGADIGPQYRSIILYHDDRQKEIAEASKAAAAKEFEDSIVTEIVPLEKFYEAESYHQDYFKKNPNAPYCVFVIHPKLKKLEKEGIFDGKGDES